MKHKVVNIWDELDEIYKYDSFGIKKVVFDDIFKIGHHYYDNFYKFNSDHFDRRLESSEESLIEAFKLKYEFGALNQSNQDLKWPLPRVLCGPNTNQKSEPTSLMLMKYKEHPLHFTFEHTEWSTGLWFAWTYFLNICSNDYLKGIDEWDENMNQNSKEAESNTLIKAYISLINSF